MRGDCCAIEIVDGVRWMILLFTLLSPELWGATGC